MRATMHTNGQVSIAPAGTRPPQTFARIHDAGGGWMICEWLISWDERWTRQIERRDRRERGFNPETPRRSAMHAAYRRKTRRR